MIEGMEDVDVMGLVITYAPWVTSVLLSPVVWWLLTKVWAVAFKQTPQGAMYAFVYSHLKNQSLWSNRSLKPGLDSNVIETNSPPNLVVGWLPDGTGFVRLNGEMLDDVLSKGQINALAGRGKSVSLAIDQRLKKEAEAAAALAKSNKLHRLNTAVAHPFLASVVQGGVYTTNNGDWYVYTDGELHLIPDNETLVAGGFNNGATVITDDQFALLAKGAPLPSQKKVNNVASTPVVNTPTPTPQAARTTLAQASINASSADEQKKRDEAAAAARTLLEAARRAAAKS